MDIIKNLIDYFNTIVTEHKYIKDFKVGEYYDDNDSGNSYPIFWVRIPFNLTVNSEKNLALFTLNISLYTNLVTDPFGNTTASTEYYGSSNIEQVNTCNNYLMSIIKRIEDESHKEGWVLIDPNNVKIETVTRVNNDDVNGVECQLTFQLPNCINYKSYFNE